MMNSISDAGPELNHRDITMFFHAIERKDIEQVKSWLEKGVPVDAKVLSLEQKYREIHWHDDDAAITLALKTKSEPIVNLIFGEKPDLINFSGRTLLHDATWSENYVQYLLEQGVDPLKTDRYNNTALPFAVLSGNIKSLELLHAAGAPLTTEEEILGELDPVLLSSHNLDLEMIEHLSSRGCDFSRVCEFGKSTIYHAGSFLTSLDGYKETVVKLISLGADINRRDNEGNTPAHFMAQDGSSRALSILISLGARTDILNNANESVLDVASEECRNFIHAHTAKTAVSALLNIKTLGCSNGPV